MTQPDGVATADWNAAVTKAGTDRAFVAHLVASGVLRRHGQPKPTKVNLAIRPKKRKR